MKYNNILIVKLSAIGDVIHALPVAHAIKQCNPDARITWVVEKAAYDLLTNNPNIDNLILFEKARYKSLGGLIANVPAFGRQLKSYRFDLVLDLQGLFKSAAISWLSGAKERLGYCDMRELSHLVSSPVCGDHHKGHVVERYLDVIRSFGCSVNQVAFPIGITAEEQQQTESIASKAGIKLDHHFVALAPGTNWTTKCWPTANYAELADSLYDNGIIPVIVGGPGDANLAAEITSCTRIPPINLVGRTNLKQLAYLIKQAKVFIGGDTGPMHLAVAVGTPVITFFGPTDPARNGPYQGNNIIIRADRSCVNCWKRSCDKVCLDTISVGTVFTAIQRIFHNE